MTYALIFFNIILMSLGQLLFKQSAIFASKHQELTQINRLILNPWFYIAGTSFAIATIIYIKILENMRLSIAYPIITTVAYILTITGAIYFFNEKLSFINVLGILIIIIGIIFSAYPK
jgi:multidrug transporter EmrE-like cation transporter